MSNTSTASKPDTTPGGPGLLEGVGGTTPEHRDAVIAGNRDVRSAATVLRDALDELHQSEDVAWKAYADQVDRALVHLDAELQVAAAQLRAERAESREDLGVALHEVAQTWRARADDARVQRRLHQMERRDAGHAALDELGRARGEVERALGDLGHELGHSITDARDAATGAIRRVGSALRHAHASIVGEDAD